MTPTTKPSAGAMKSAREVAAQFGLRYEDQAGIAAIIDDNGLREMAEALEAELNTAENADETGYVTDVGFVDLDKLHANSRAVLARYHGKDAK